MSAQEIVIVTIDGGAASGKSSTASRLSERFNLLHVDTGSFYRTVTLALLSNNIDGDDATEIGKALPGLKIETRVSGRRALMELDGEVPGEELRSQEVNNNVSKFAAQPAVRSFLYSYQRNQASIALEHGLPGVVMEGRDIGSVIFPDAAFRFFLQASQEERQRRRAEQGEHDEIGKRDKIDSGRKTAPLVCPQGAIAIDSTHLSLEEVVEQMSRVIEKSLPRATR